MNTGIVVSAFLLGCVAALLIPSGWELFLILPPLIACIGLSWFITFQNKAIQLRPFRLFFWPLIDITAPVRRSKALVALFAAAAFVAGSCLALLIRVQNA